MKIIRTAPYIKALKKIGISADTEQKLLNELANNPEKGDLIIGSGGARKIRLALGNRGKSAGARVVYAFFKLHDKIFLIYAYKKATQENLTQTQINNLKIAIKTLEETLNNGQGNI